MVSKFNNFRPQLVFAEQSAGSAVVLTNEQKLSLYKKSQKSGFSTNVLEEVYRRGYAIWNESFGQTAEQFAFDRVNSFVAGGFAAELDEDLMENKNDLLEAHWSNTKPNQGFEHKGKVIGAIIKSKNGYITKRRSNPDKKNAKQFVMHHKTREDAEKHLISKSELGEEVKKPTGDLKQACWKGYTAVGMKMKNGRKVPNCVPVKEEHKGKHFKTAETVEKQSKNANDPDSRFDGTKSAKNVYQKATPGQPVTESKLATIKRVVAEATYKGRKVSLNKPFRTPGGKKKSAVYVDPDGDGKAKIVRFGDPKLSIKKDQPARKRSYCARSSGQGNLTKKDSANYWSRKAWDC